MTQILTASQMREIEQWAIESGAVTGLALMERAGQGVVDAVFEEWPEFANEEHRAVVLCGPGNNGGDGFVVARLLKAAGWEVAVYLHGDPDRLPPDARKNYQRWGEIGSVSAMLPHNISNIPRPDLIVDAVFGTGLTRALCDNLAGVLKSGGKTLWKGGYAPKTVAIDCPSGLNLDNGLLPVVGSLDDPDFDPWPKALNWADLTVTFHSPKPGHYLWMGPGLCGKLKVVDIGLRGDAHERGTVGMPPDCERARLVEPTFLHRPVRGWPAHQIGKYRGQGHKFDHGHIVVFSGGVGRGGAGRMAARAALRSGAGLATLLCPPSALQENACQLNAIMLRALPAPEDLSQVADNRVTGFCIGPGLGVSDRTRATVKAVLTRPMTDRDWRAPAVVLDADALTVFAQTPEELFALVHDRTVLTPHEGEFERLFPDLSQARRGEMSKIDVVRIAAKRAGCIVLLKGVDTVIAQPDGGASVHAAVYEREAPWLATAGAGDVLAGFIAGLAGAPTSADLFNMVEIAAWLHVECARSFGPGLIAEDLPEELPKVLSSVMAQAARRTAPRARDASAVPNSNPSA